jgi:myo-inositol 2-dehydrogenase / D-chiro-inositol 1-dehydrogenase
MSTPVADQIRIGIIGAGLIGRTHSRMLRRIGERTSGSLRVIAVADREPRAAENLAARWPEARALASAAELIADETIDAVWICTPTAYHREACLMAARAGKHIFCEKPLAMSVADAQEMASAISSAGVISQVGLVLRFSPVYTVMRALVSDPGAGAVLAVTMRDDQDFPIRGVHNSAWRNDPSVTAGGTLVEHSVHDFDLLTWMFGPLRRIYCRTRNLKGASGIEDFGATQMEFAAGFHGQLTSVWHGMIGRPSNRRLEIFAENLFLACDHDSVGPIVVQRGSAAREEVLSEAEVMERFTQLVLSERPYLSPLKDSFALPYALEDGAFAAALRGECVSDPAFDQGITAQRLVEAAYASSRQGLSVVVPV